MKWFKSKILAKIFEAKNSALIFTIIFVIYVLSSFDVCWFFVGEGVTNNGFVFGSSWREHLHSSEGWTIYHQVEAFHEGRGWLSRYSPPKFSVDFIKIGEYYYAPFEPLTAIVLLPFYTVGNLLLGEDYLIRSVLVGMIFYTCINALLVRKISFQISRSQSIANLAALLFALTTMAFSYSRLLYPQPIVGMLTLFTMLFLFNYKRNKDAKNLFYFSLFYGLAVASFNALIITMPFILYFLIKNELLTRRRDFRNIGLGLLPSILLFIIWNHIVTGNLLMTPRQVVNPYINFEFLYTTTNGTWLNLEGLFGSLFSPLGIFFVSPILFASFIGFSSLRLKAKDETTLLASLAIVFWVFISFMNRGGAAGRDFWVGGWANIARYMYISSTILIIFTAEVFEKINKNRSLLGAWLISVLSIVSFLANFSYGARHDLMVGHLNDFISNSLLVWPYTLKPIESRIFFIIIVLASLAYPLYLVIPKIRRNIVTVLEYAEEEDVGLWYAAENIAKERILKTRHR